MATSGSSSVQRLTKAREFDEVFKGAKYRANCPGFLVLAIENRQSFSRIGMVVSKRTAGNAVNRNRIRRLIRESFRLRFDMKGLDVVMVARPPASKMENSAMLEVLSDLWVRLSKTVRVER